MVLPQKNFAMLTYVDNDGTSWNIRAESPSAFDAVNGTAPAIGTQPRWPRRSNRNQPRRIEYLDPTTFRKAIAVFFTSAAYAAVTLGDIVAVPQPGTATSVNYQAVRKLPELKESNVQVTPSLPDHA